MAVTQTSRTYAFGELLTTKLRTFLENNPVEQSQLGNAFLDKVYQTNKHSVNASNEYTVPVSFLEAQKGGWYDGADVTSTAGSDDVTIAHYDTAFNTEPVKLLRTEMKRGAKGIFDLMSHKSMQAMKRCKNGVAAALMGYTKTTKATETVPLAIAEAPSGTAFGGIDGANNSGWLNQFKDMSAGLAATLVDLDEVSIECTKNGLTDWDYIVTTTSVYRWFKSEARTNQTIDIGTAPAGSRFADTGWTGVTFEGKPVIHDRHLEDGRTGGDSLFFVNDDAMYLNVDPTEDFVLEGPFPLQGGGQHGMLWNVYWAGQLIVTERAALGVVFDITGA